MTPPRPYSWRAIFLLANAFGLLLFLYHALDRVARQEPVEWLVIFLEEMTGAYAALPLIPLVIRLTLRTPLRRWPVFLAAGVAYGLAQTTIIYGLRLAVFGAFGMGRYDYGLIPVRYLMELPLQLLLFGMLVIGISFVEQRREARERALRHEATERQLAEARLAALELQLQPHFLFNALNAVAALVYEDPRAADRMIGRLSEFLRRVLAAERAQEVPLRSEIELMNLYLDVMRARFEDRLWCEVRVEAGLEDALAPRLVLQPVVENAIRHGADPATAKIRLTVEAKRAGDGLTLVVRDEGPGASGDNGWGVGLSNLSERLARLYGARAKLEIGSAEGGGARVLIQLPMVKR